VAEPGLRERKKAKLRAQLVDVADDLFIARGFAAVTLEEIAAQCEVSVRTLLRYFPTKEALALAYEHDLFERFRDGLVRRPGDVLGYWRYYIGMNAAAFAARADWHRSRYRMMRGLPLYAVLVGLREEYQQLLATALLEDGTADTELAAELLAAMLVAGNHHALRRFLDSEAEFDSDSLLEVIDVAVSLFTRGVSSSDPR
jgi:AcrR family transcriptional regulator